MEFCLNICTTYFVAAGSAVLQGAICGLASMFPHNYMQSVFSGMVSAWFLQGFTLKNELMGEPTWTMLYKYKYHKYHTMLAYSMNGAPPACTIICVLNYLNFWYL